ncbi:LADA_0H11848g1_1 [Lachancea dasiensis]|uniref:LADA_0H11848g1_1 n=1 Tax=Lachancea dasiensis TaxID=1072105 RepID=A0A1G4K3N4_9SACH|nr:LADA_0H11848g1_1 [Lachancea dasiensis]
MSTYSEKSFDSEFYQENRPTYPKSLYRAIVSYHQGPAVNVIDIGCGTGISTFPLLEYFGSVIGSDPSSTMLTSAERMKSRLNPHDQNRLKFQQCAAEEISSLAKNSTVDMVVGAESVHWLDHDRFFDQVHQVLRPGGTVAYWFYVEPIFLDFPEANVIYEKYVYEDPAYMGPLWKSGKENLRYFGEPINIPHDKFGELQKHIYRPLQSNVKTQYYEHREAFTMNDFRKYLRSWSAYHTWQQKYGGTGADVAEMLIQELKQRCNWDEQTPLRVEWGTAYYMARKK